MIDVVVAGGGPAGLATALHAARAGLDVVVLEPRSAPIDKACGEGLMPAAVAALAELGVDPEGMPFRGIRYLSPTASADSDFRHGPGRGVRRTVLQQALQSAVEQAGIPIVPERAHGITQSSSSVSVAGYTARYLVGADGLHSPIREELALGRAARKVPKRLQRKRFGIRAHFDIAPWSEYVEVSWGADSESYVTPVGPNCVGVAVLTSRKASFDEHLRAFPALAERLSEATRGDVRAAGPLRQSVTHRVRGRVALIGDAAGYVDALTGEGIALSLACAPALVARIVSDDIAGYENDYGRISRSYRLLTGSLLAATRVPLVRRLLVPGAQRLPRVFDAAVGQLAG